MEGHGSYNYGSVSSPFGWCGIEVEVVCGLSSGEIRGMLETCARRVVGNEWACA